MKMHKMHKLIQNAQNAQTAPLLTKARWQPLRLTGWFSLVSVARLSRRRAEMLRISDTLTTTIPAA